MNSLEEMEKKIKELEEEASLLRKRLEAIENKSVGFKPYWQELRPHWIYPNYRYLENIC